MELNHWRAENERLWKQAEESGVRLPIEPPVTDMPRASEEEREVERLRRENEKIKEALEWRASLGGEAAPLAPGVSAKMTYEEGEANKQSAKELEQLVQEQSQELEVFNSNITQTRKQMSGSTERWPRLPDSLVAVLPEDEQLLIRQHEEETIAASKLQLHDICDNCRNKMQFAKTFRVLRRDLRKSLQKARAHTSQPHSVLSDAYFAALIRSTDMIVSYKLDLMSRHFLVQWDEPIENWAGREGSTIDKAGCSVLLLIAGTAVSGTLCLFFQLIE